MKNFGAEKNKRDRKSNRERKTKVSGRADIVYNKKAIVNRHMRISSTIRCTDKLKEEERCLLILRSIYTIPTDPP